MKTQATAWLDVVIAFLFLTNTLLLMHFLHYGIRTEQSAQILVVLLFYTWLSGWAKTRA